MKKLKKIMVVIIMICMCISLSPATNVFADNEQGFTIHYHSPSGDKDIPYTDLVQDGLENDPSISIANPSEIGLGNEDSQFIAWNTASDGSGTTYQSGEKFLPFEIDKSETEMDLYAQYEIKQNLNTSIQEKTGAQLKQIVYHNGKQAFTVAITSINGEFINNKITGFTPANEELTFVGWSTVENDFNSQMYLADDIIPYELYSGKESIDLYAMWEKDTPHIVAFDANDGDGTVPATIKGSFGEKRLIPVSGNLVKEEKPFAYWNTKKDGTGDTYCENAEIILKKDITLYAVYGEAYTVTYELNLPDAKYATAPTDPYKYLKGALTYFLLPANYENEDYVFKGWNTNKNAKEADGNYNKYDRYEINEDITFYGIWKKKTNFQVVYDCTSFDTLIPDDSCPVDTNTYQLMDTIQRKDFSFDYDFIKDTRLVSGKLKDYYFSGWKIQNYFGNGTDTNLPGFDDKNIIDEKMINVENKVILEPQWNTTNYGRNKLYFDKNTEDNVQNFPNNALTLSDTDFNPGYELPREIPKREGYLFEGWKLIGSTSDKIFTNGDRIELEDFDEKSTAVLQAIWEPIDTLNKNYIDIKINFNNDSMTLRFPKNANVFEYQLMNSAIEWVYDDSNKALSLSWDSQYYLFDFLDSNENYLFDSKSFISAEDFPQGDITLKAPSYEVVYKNGLHGELKNQPLNQTQEYALTLINIPDPIPERGYRFAGWQLTPTIYVGPEFLSAFSSPVKPESGLMNSVFIKSTEELKTTRIWNRLFTNEPRSGWGDGEQAVSLVTITPVFEPLDKTQVTIEYYYDDVLDASKTETLSKRENTLVKQYPDKAGEEYEFDKSDNFTLEVKKDPKDNVIKIYYVRKKTSATIEYYYDGKLDASKSETLTEQKAGSQITTYTDKAIENYTLDKVENLPLTLDVNKDKNIIKVYYVKKATPVKPSVPNTPAPPVKGVSTGDTEIFGLWMGLAIVSLGMTLFIWKRREEKIKKISNNL